MSLATSLAEARRSLAPLRTQLTKLDRELPTLPFVAHRTSIVGSVRASVLLARMIDEALEHAEKELSR